MGFYDKIKPETVNDFDTFCVYVNQEIGVPKPTVREKIVSRKLLNQFFDDNPTASWATLVKTVQHVKSVRKRYKSMVGLVTYAWRDAWKDGLLEELDPDWEENSSNVNGFVDKALEVETDPVWRRKLIVGKSAGSTRKVYGEWLKERGDLYGF